MRSDYIAAVATAKEAPEDGFALLESGLLKGF
jgi:hypothetical protein